MQVTRRTVLAGSIAAAGVSSVSGGVSAANSMNGSVERWGVFEIQLAGPSAGNPFVDVKLNAVFQSGAEVRTAPGFYDGDGVYRIRFSPPSEGKWEWESHSNDKSLDGQSGQFACLPASTGNHGPVKVTPDGYHFAYADGTKFCQIGTTSYAWALQSQSLCRETIESLRDAPFNKVRMCVFPNVPSLMQDPFQRTGDGLKDWDQTRFNPSYFRVFEQRVRELGALGIEADIILFHPYDKKRGYSDMNRDGDELYLSYINARLGAYRNVWWSMANEFDLVKSKSTADWDHLLQYLSGIDAYGRLLSIHQIHNYYDQRKPWLSHASIQNGAAVTAMLPAQLHRSFAEKPVIFDEICYEGNIEYRWGDLTAQEMVERFWWGTIAGTYVGHGETIDPDRNPDRSFLGIGGRLRGESAPRLAFLKHIMEDAPTPGIDPIQTWWGYTLGGQPFEYYLTYFGAEQPENWKVVLPGKEGDPHHRYTADIIDTWNMTITPVEGVFTMSKSTEYDFSDPARPEIILPGKPYLAVRLKKYHTSS